MGMLCPHTAECAPSGNRLVCLINLRAWGRSGQHGWERGGFCWTVNGLDSLQTHLQGQIQLRGRSVVGRKGGAAREEGVESGLRN